MRIAFLLLFLLFSFIGIQAQGDCSTGCEPLWLEVPFGGKIGSKNTFIKYDFDKDGEEDYVTFEVIEVDESHNNGTSSSRDGSFLYAMNYNSVEAKFEKIHITDIQKAEFSHVARGDINNDGKDELLVTVFYNLMYIYDFETLQLIECIDRPWGGGNPQSYELQVMDIDDDGQNEILVCTAYDFYIYDSNTMTEEFHAEGFWSDFEVGNVDNDANLEIVLSDGTIYQFINQNYQLEYELDIFSTDLVELWDIDNDGNQEVVIERQHNIALYDIESSTLIYDEYLGGDSWLIRDLDNDGSLEFITLDDFWNKIEIYNLNDASLKEEIEIELEFTNNDLFSLMIDDFDDNGSLELLVTFEDIFGRPGGIRIYDLSNGNIISDSNREFGAYHAIELEDVDGDGKSELVTASGVGPGYGNEFAKINIYDASTKELERRITMPEDVSLESRHIEVADYGNDGDLDIVILGENWPDIELLVYDGATGNLEHNFLLEDYDFDSMKGYALEDIDEDGVDEILAFTQETFRILNPTDLSTEWESFSLDQFYEGHTIITGNIDNDVSLEMIMSKEWIYRFDDHNNDFTLVQSANNNYRAIYLFDWNGDGTKEIIGGTTEGTIDVLNGVNMNVLESFKFSEFPISAISSGDLEGDGIPDLLVTSLDQLFIHRVNRNTLVSQVYGIEVGEFDGLKLRDVDNDGTQDVFVGSWYGLIEVDETCVECFSVDFSPEVVQPTCYEDNGWILVNSGDPTAVFNLEDNEVVDTLKNLGPGDYTFTVTNDLGCELEYLIRLDYENDFEREEFEVEWKDPICGGDGVIYIETLNLDLKFMVDGVEFEDSINNLFFGDRELVAFNNYGCFKEVTVDLGEPVTPHYDIITTGCGPDDYKYIDLRLLYHSGHDPKVYWNDEFIEPDFSFDYTILPEEGIGVLEVRMDECSIFEEIEITPIDPLNTLEFDLDFSNIVCGEELAWASVQNFKNGQGPYQAFWDGGEFVGFFNLLEEGTHIVELIDNTGCSTTKYFEIFKELEISYDLEIIYEGCQSGANTYAVISNLENTGQGYTISWDGQSNGLTSHALLPGSHQLTIWYGDNCIEQYTFNVDQNAGLDASLNQTSTYCDEFNLATVEVEVLNGIEPFDYKWTDNVSNSYIAQNLTPGSYWVTITDADSCQSILNIEVEDDQLSIDLNVVNVLCFGEATGEIQIDIVSGEGPFAYMLDGNGGSPILTGLEAGDYQILVSDSNGCSDAENVTIEQPEPLTLSAIILLDSLSTSELEGSISVEVSGGVKPYEYFWTTGSTDSLITSLSSGNYLFSIEDSNGCVLDSIFVIDEITSVFDFEDFTISLFPNPTQQIVNIESSKELEIDSVCLYRLDGRLVKKDIAELLINKNHRLDLGEVNDGIYILVLQAYGKVIKHKLAVFK